MRRVSLGTHNCGALDGDDFTPHSPLRVSPNGLRLSGARKGARCSRGLDGRSDADALATATGYRPGIHAVIGLDSELRG